MSNDVIIEAWNTVLFEKFSRFKFLFIHGYADMSKTILDRIDFSDCSSILEVGCGFGDCTLDLALRAGEKVKVVGVDCAQNFIDECEKEKKQRDIKNIEFITADVEMDDLRGPHDFVFARFGTMFFNFPGRAMKNIYKSLKPGGKFVQVVWRKREDNPWLYDAECCVKAIVPVVTHEETDAVHCGPGPFSMAGPDMVSEMLQASGFERVQFERLDSELYIGKDMEEAIQFALDLGPAGEAIRFAGEEGEKLKPQVIKALRDVLQKYVRDDGTLWAPSSAWVISAQKPAL